MGPGGFVVFAGPGRCVCRRAAARRGACFVGPGRCVCRRAAARPRDHHTRAWRLGVVDLEARPGPATAHRHRGLALQASAGPAAASYRSGLVVCVLPALALRALLRPPHRRLRCCVWWRVDSMPGRPHGSFPSVGDYRCERPGPATAHQFRMQFPSGVVLVCVSLQCCVTRVCELHATFA